MMKEYCVRAWNEQNRNLRTRHVTGDKVHPEFIPFYSIMHMIINYPTRYTDYETLNLLVESYYGIRWSIEGFGEYEPTIHHPRVHGLVGGLLPQFLTLLGTLCLTMASELNLEGEIYGFVREFVGKKYPKWVIKQCHKEHVSDFENWYSDTYNEVYYPWFASERFDAEYILERRQHRINEYIRQQEEEWEESQYQQILQGLPQIPAGGC